MSKFYKLKVLECRAETAEAKSIRLELPEEYREDFQYKPGQYLTIKLQLNGKEVRRSYSLCSSPAFKEALKITVKKVKDGLVSNYINDHLKAGDFLEAMPPSGRFFVETNAAHYKTYYLFAAGSGITPVFSIVRSLLALEKNSFVHLLYGNRDQEHVIFKEELETLKKQYPEKFVLEYIFSRTKSNWSDLWKLSTKDAFQKGRIDSQKIKWFIDKYPPYAQNAVYYICGPGNMIESTKSALQEIDVPKARIFFESFGAAKGKTISNGVDNAQLTVRLNGETIKMALPKGKTVLRALIDEGFDPPYSCEGGVCATCMCKVSSGNLAMRKNMALDKKRIQDGFVLSCQSIAMTDEVALTFEY